MNYFVRRQDNEYGTCDGMLHEIKEGDTLYKISRMHGVTVGDLLEKNPTVDVYNLTIGDKLCIPVKHLPYIIQKGDTLDWLLEHFNLDYDTFRRANAQLESWQLPENEIVYIPQNTPEG
jgi:spore germination protein YaaH